MVGPALAGHRSDRLVGGASEVIRAGVPSEDLDARWDAALSEGRQGSNDFWIGYVLPRSAANGDKGGLLCDSEGIDLSLLEDSYDGPVLADVLAGNDPRILFGKRKDARSSELAILVHVSASGRDGARIDRFRAQTLGLPAEVLGRQPLYALESGPDELRGEAVQGLKHHPVPAVLDTPRAHGAQGPFSGGPTARRRGARPSRNGRVRQTS